MRLMDSYHSTLGSRVTKSRRGDWRGFSVCTYKEPRLVELRETKCFHKNVVHRVEGVGKAGVPGRARIQGSQIVVLLKSSFESDTEAEGRAGVPARKKEIKKAGVP